jgi:hypothetical protein
VTLGVWEVMVTLLTRSTRLDAVRTLGWRKFVECWLFLVVRLMALKNIDRVVKLGDVGCYERR